MSPSHSVDDPQSSQAKTFRRPKIQVSRDFPVDSGAVKTLPDLIEFNAENNSDDLFALQEVRDGGKHVDLTRITFRDLRDATQAAARILQKTLSPVQDTAYRSNAPVALFVESDIVLFVYLAALLYLDIPVLLLSIRLSPAAIVHLLTTTSARAIIVSQRSQTTVSEAIQQLSNEGDQHLQQITSISYKALLEVGKKERGNVKQAVHSLDRFGALILHSSGTTGLPKPISLAHRYVLGYAACHRLRPDQCVDRLTLSTLPMYHGFGLLAPSISLATGSACCFLSTSIVPSAPSVYELIERSGASSLMTVPSILEDFTYSPSNIESLVGMDFVAVGGGAIKPGLGEHLSSHGVKLLNHYGATEIGAIAPIFFPGEDYDWHYLRLRTDMGLEVDQVKQEQTDGAPVYQLTGYPFGWGEPFVVQDILERRPDSDHVEVKILGRQDDLIVLSTGEKILPQALEAALMESPRVKTAIVFGQHQPETGVLVEPSTPLSAGEERQFVEHVWGIVDRENARLDRHARIGLQSMVVVKPAHKVVPRSDKGSVMRKEAYRVFLPEIEAAYRHKHSDITAAIVLSTDPQELCVDLHRLVQQCARDRISNLAFNDDDDFFALGMDSLEATRVARMLSAVDNKALFPGLRQGEVKPVLIYQNPSVAALVRALRSDPITDTGSPISDTAQLMLDMVADFSPIHDRPDTPRKATVLLTGSTGHLGVYLLQKLCLDPQVGQVVCLNRSHKGELESPAIEKELELRQHEANTARRIQLSSNSWSKIRFLPSNHLDQARLGLSPTDYQQLTTKVTHIVHNAWPMDFQRSLLSFKAQISGVKNLIRLAIDCSWAQPARGLRSRFLLVSSIAVAAQSPSRPMVREERIRDPTSVSAFGYAQAKWVSEQILLDNLQDSPPSVRSSIVRLGQISGGTSSGVWNPKEHLPALLRLSQLVGALPDLDGTYSWIPVDVAAHAVLDILFTSDKTESETDENIYHVENPIRQPWKPLLSALATQLHLRSVAPLSLHEWLECAAASVQTDEDRELFGQLKPFLGSEFHNLASGGVILDTTQARKVSRALRTCNGIGLDLVNRYLQYWRAVGVLA
ncbi:hypothetical protein BDW74DRAFT_188176 [Aspergillus multicolor]|uniref:uncharacterized protein n=1 Tax=Aspergillus multicolor TaxID=41759 RepID=UPI003CCC9086